MSFFERIKMLCEQKNLTFYAIERCCNFGNGTIKRWNKQNPSIDKVAKLANMLNVSIDYLVFGEEYKIGVELDEAEENLLMKFRQLNASDKLIVMEFMEQKLDQTFLNSRKTPKATASVTKNGNGSIGEEEPHTIA